MLDAGSWVVVEGALLGLALRLELFLDDGLQPLGRDLNSAFVDVRGDPPAA